MSLNDRRNDIESRYAHDQEMKFKIEARRNKLVGLWAAEKLGKTGAEADEYAQETVKASFMRPGDEGVFAKLRADFDAANVDQSDHQIRRHLAELLVEAEAQVAAA
ncbi:DUF1476 domain-containing protein [Aureimonas mangrovi]|uniref:DUF1476 domain-containing protein n=1 Tax=Aureimonas mangrovi TaxID=2758041 RepID=UPI00163D5A44|nr:DUF1476 domain-containing protein [Aureimonas mangrovi]